MTFVIRFMQHDHLYSWKSMDKKHINNNGELKELRDMIKVAECGILFYTNTGNEKL